MVRKVRFHGLVLILGVLLIWTGVVHDMYECSNSRVISLLSVVFKVNSSAD